jgi:DNA-binding NarL/FixJ family response regulator
MPGFVGDSRLTLVLAEDSQAVADEIARLLEPEYTVLERVEDGAELVHKVGHLHPDVVVSDIDMPGLNGIEAGRRIVSSGTCASVILLTMYNDAHLVRAAMDAGIRGFVLKSDAGDELSQAIRAVFRGATYLSRSVAR